MPKISVILPVHNGMPFLSEAIGSVLDQSFHDFECLLIDDGSSDGSQEYFQSLTDQRLSVLVHKQQKGLAASLNEGFELAQGDFIARMDADDICHPQRFKEQIAYLQAHPQVDICGTWARTFGEGREQLWRYPETDSEIKAEMLFASVLVHSSVMLRAATVRSQNIRYEDPLKAAQDYELWSRIQDQVQFANVPKLLMDYRIHPEQVGAISGTTQQRVADEVRERQLERLGLKATAEEKTLHHRIARWDFGVGLDDLGLIEDWLLKLWAMNTESSLYDSGSLSSAIERRWWVACRAQAKEGLTAWRRYHSSRLAKLAPRAFADRTQFFAKSAAFSLGVRR